MWMYDLTGGLRIGKLHQRVSTDEALRYMPTLRAPNVAGAYIYYDAAADDARLTLAIARTAADARRGRRQLRARSSGSSRTPTARVARRRVVADGQTIDVRARVVVNATGVWSDDVRALDEGTHPASIRPAKGVHITVPWSMVQNEIAASCPVPKDRRSVFVVPWGEPRPTSARPTPTTTARSTIRSSRPTTSSICSARSTRAVDDRSVPRRRARDVGRAPAARCATATSERTADLSRRHSVRTSPTAA